jgi:xanthine dehydrogenase small subunit
MGGNVANGSPIGDSAPVLIALGASLVLRRGDRQRRVPLEDFYLDYMKNALEPGEFVEAIEVPTSGDVQLRAYKVSKRFDSDISAVSAGMAIVLDGERVREVRLAYGGMAAIVRRAAGAEAALCGQSWDEAALEAAIAALARDFKPLTDMRASAGYRQQVAGNLLRRFWLETRPEGVLPEGAVSVFARAARAPA